MLSYPLKLNMLKVYIQIEQRRQRLRKTRSVLFHAAVKTKLVTQNTYSVLFCEKLNNLLLAYHEISGARKPEPSCMRYALPTRTVLMWDYKNTVVIDGINSGDFQAINCFLGKQSKLFQPKERYFEENVEISRLRWCKKKKIHFWIAECMKFLNDLSYLYERSKYWIFRSLIRQWQVEVWWVV